MDSKEISLRNFREFKLCQERLAVGWVGVRWRGGKRGKMPRGQGGRRGLGRGDMGSRGRKRGRRGEKRGRRGGLRQQNLSSRTGSARGAGVSKLASEQTELNLFSFLMYSSRR